MRRQIVPIAAVTVVITAMTGCPRPRGNDPARQTDASPSASAQAPAAPREAQLVAMSRNTPRFLPLGAPGAPGDTAPLVLDAGVFLYEATRDGVLRRFGDVASYSGLLPDNDDELAGYDVPNVRYRSRIVGTPPAITVVFQENADDGARRWNGTAWTVTRAPDLKEEVSESRKGFTDLPKGFRPHDVFRTTSGLRVVYGSDQALDKYTTYVVAPDGKPKDGGQNDESTGSVRWRHVPLDLEDHADYCSFPTSQDGEAYLHCHAGSSESLVRLGHDTWTKVALPEPKKRVRGLAIADDGAVWMGDGNEIIRKTKDGAVERFTPPPIDVGLARATLHTNELPMAKKPNAHSDIRFWEALAIERRDPDVALTSEPTIEKIMPEPGGQAWVVARGSSSWYLVVHVGPKRTEAPFAIGSTADQRNEVRNTRPVRTWVGHCGTLFVTLARETADGAFAPERAFSRTEDITKILKQSFARETVREGRAAMIEGRLGGKRVAGVLLYRPVPDATEASMENAANRLVGAFTSDPTSPPAVTCTVPVLSRAEPL